MTVPTTFNLPDTGLTPEYCTIPMFVTVSTKEYAMRTAYNCAGGAVRHDTAFSESSAAFSSPSGTSVK